MKVSAIVATGVLSLAVAGVSAQGVTDAQIASIVVTANQVDIDAGKLAASTSKNKDLKAFAQRMATDHEGVNKAATELVTKIKVTPEDNPTSQSLKSAGDTNVANLKTLIPGASNEELKALLVKARPMFVDHIEQARKLQASVSKATS